MRRIATTLLVASLTLFAGQAFAQEKTAADLQTEAKAALGRGEIPQACLLFDQAYQLSSKAAADAPGPKPMELLFELADCHEKQGYASLAATEFEQVSAG